MIPGTLILGLCLDFLRELQEGGSYLITHLQEVPVLVLADVGPPCTSECPVAAGLGASVILPRSAGCMPAFGTLGFKP